MIHQPNFTLFTKSNTKISSVQYLVLLTYYKRVSEFFMWLISTSTSKNCFELDDSIRVFAISFKANSFKLNWLVHSISKYTMAKFKLINHHFLLTR